MRASQIAEAVNLCVERQRPAFIWGPPGVGKSDVVAQVAAARGIELRDVRLNLLDPTDIKGFPVPDVKKKQMTWLPADFLPRDGEGILFLDELNQAPPAVQAAAYQLTLNRQVGDYVLPDGWAIIAAGNRETDRANAMRMPSALANRLVHLDFDVNVDDWCEWALDQGDAVPVELLSFIRFRKDLLHKHEPAERAFPTPRSWTFAGSLINSGISAEVEFELIKGAVGEGAAAEFKGYLSVYRDLPTVDQVLLNPKDTPISENAAVKFAITASLAHSTTKDTFPRFMQYVGRMDAEWQVVYVRDAMKRTERAITTLKEFQTFALKHAHLLA